MGGPQLFPLILPADLPITTRRPRKPRSFSWKEVTVTPWKMNGWNPKNGGFEDEFPFQLGDL